MTVSVELTLVELLIWLLTNCRFYRHTVNTTSECHMTKFERFHDYHEVCFVLIGRTDLPFSQVLIEML